MRPFLKTIQSSRSAAIFAREQSAVLPRSPKSSVPPSETCPSVAMFSATSTAIILSQRVFFSILPKRDWSFPSVRAVTAEADVVVSNKAFASDKSTLHALISRSCLLGNTLVALAFGFGSG